MLHDRPRSRAPFASLLLFLAGASACADGPTAPKGVATFRLDLSATTLELGDFLEVTLTNRGAGTGYFDFCDAPLQIREGGEWITLRSLRLCLLRFTPLAPDQSVVAPMLMERAGVVRVAVPVKASVGSAPDTLFSREIVVTER